jgi:hypothetical protein
MVVIVWLCAVPNIIMAMKSVTVTTCEKPAFFFFLIDFPPIEEERSRATCAPAGTAVCPIQVP